MRRPERDPEVTQRLRSRLLLERCDDASMKDLLRATAEVAVGIQRAWIGAHRVDVCPDASTHRCERCHYRRVCREGWA